MQVLKPLLLAENSTLGGDLIAKKKEIPKKLPADGGDADTIGGKGPNDFAPANHIGSGGSAHALATTTSAGFMGSSDKVKLSGISTGANKTTSSTTNGNILVDGSQVTVYTHPSTHPATMITEDTNHQFVTAAQISSWTAKQNALGFTPENIAHKGIAGGYASLDASSRIPVSQMPVNTFVPVSHVGSGGNAHSTATTTVAGFMSSSDKVKLNAISEGANKTSQSATNGNVQVDGSQIVVYAHPSTHPATMITEDTGHRFVTDSQISTWNAKQNALTYTPENAAKKGVASGYASLDAMGKIPLNQLPDTAKQQTYIVSGNTEMNNLTGLISGDKCFQTGTGDTYIYNGTSWVLMSDADWANVSLTWDNISGKPSATPSTIDDAVNKRHTHSNKATLDAITAAFTTAMETKLNGIATNANKYTHPSTHPATMITEDSTHRFVTDAQVSVWDAKQNALGYTPLNKASNLSDITNVSSARTNLGLTGDSNTTHYHDGRYFTKTQLNTNGQGAAVHWGNITNAPTSMPANGGNADTIGGLTPSQFLRSDTDDSMTGTLSARAFVANTSESKLSRGTFVDPISGVTQTLKVSGGMASDTLYAKEKIEVNKFSIEFNSTENSLDFCFG